MYIGIEPNCVVNITEMVFDLIKFPTKAGRAHLGQETKYNVGIW
jgi:hypothetical protein